MQCLPINFDNTYLLIPDDFGVKIFLAESGFCEAVLIVVATSEIALIIAMSRWLRLPKREAIFMFTIVYKAS